MQPVKNLNTVETTSCGRKGEAGKGYEGRKRSKTWGWGNSLAKAMQVNLIPVMV